MRKIAIWTIILSTFLLASCSLIHKKKEQPAPDQNMSKVTNKKALTPDEILRQTQNNFIDSLENNVFVKEQTKFDGIFKFVVNSNEWQWNGILSYNGEWNKDIAKIDLNFSWSATAQWQSWKVNLYSTFISNSKKIYIKLNKINAQLPDPKLQSYIAMAGMILNKWFYFELPTDNNKLSLKLKKIDIRKHFKKYNIFKVDKIIKDREYEVSLDKKNISSIIYNVSKELNPSFTWTKAQILSGMQNWNLTWVLSIKWNRYFTFSWNITNKLNVVPFQFKYLDNKFYIKTQGLVVDMDRNNDKFNGTVEFTDQFLKFDVNWKLNKDIFEASIKYDNNSTKVNVDLSYKATKIDKLDIKMPNDENAVNLQSVLWWMWQWWFSNQNIWLPTQQNWR